MEGEKDGVEELVVFTKSFVQLYFLNNLIVIIRVESHNCQMVDFFFSWMGGLSLDALKGRRGVS